MIGHFFRLAWALIRENKGLFGLGLTVGILIIFLATHFSSLFPSRQKNSRIGVIGNYTLATLPYFIQEELSFGLTRVLSDQTATPAAAVSWEATDSGRLYAFKLNPNLYWHDGKKFLASDINYNFADVRINPGKDNTVVFHLKSSYAPLPSAVSQPLFRPGFIGLGKYRLSGVQLNGRFLRSLAITKNHGGKETITYRFYPTKTMATTALKLGEVQKIIDVYDPRGAPDYREEAVVLLNTRSGDLADKSFRQALAYSLPDHFTQGQEADGPIPPTSWFYNPNLKKYPQDFAQGKELVKKSLSSSSATLRLVTSDDLSPVAEILAANWAKIGVQTKITVSDVIPSDYDAFLTYLEIPSDPDQYLFWHSTSDQNISGYKSPKVDRLLEEGRQILDPEVRKDKYAEFQKAITEDLPALFLYFPKVYTLTRSSL